MAPRSSLGESALHDNLGIQQNRKFTKPVGIILAVWFIAMTSLLGVHYFLKRKPRANKAGILKIQAKYNSLSDEQKTIMKYSESGIIELANGDLCVIDGTFKESERSIASGKGLAWRRIEFAIEDPLFLERQMMIKEALGTLNNAERRCLTDRHVAIIYDNGSYYLIIDPKIYADYVSKYGTECKSCGDQKGDSTSNLK
jgi:hypothetical protein